MRLALLSNLLGAQSNSLSIITSFWLIFLSFLPFPCDFSVSGEMPKADPPRIQLTWNSLNKAKKERLFWYSSDITGLRRPRKVHSGNECHQDTQKCGRGESNYGSSHLHFSYLDKAPDKYVVLFFWCELVGVPASRLPSLQLFSQRTHFLQYAESLRLLFIKPQINTWLARVASILYLLEYSVYLCWSSALCNRFYLAAS